MQTSTIEMLRKVARALKDVQQSQFNQNKFEVKLRKVARALKDVHPSQFNQNKFGFPRYGSRTPADAIERIETLINRLEETQQPETK